MADSSSPEQQDAAAPSALTPRIDHAPDVAVRPADHPAVVRRLRAPARRPLPDAVAITSVAVPDAAPPYDGAMPATVPSRSGASGDDTEVARAIAAVRALTDASRVCVARPGQGQFTGHWPSQFAQVLAETLAGSRSPTQLTPWTTHQTRRRISQLGRALSTAHRPRVKRVIVTSPAGGVLEMAVIVGLGTRVRALAVRLERTQPVVPPGEPVVPPGEPAPASIEQPAWPGELSPAEQPAQRAAPQGWICTAIEAA